MNSSRRGWLGVLALFVAALALVAAGCGGDDEGSGDGATTEASGGSSSGVEALPSSSCTAIEYKGEGDADVLLASDFPLQGSSRTQTIQIVEAIRYLLEQSNYKAGDHNVAYQSCDDATAQAGKWDSGKCSTNAQAYAGNEKVVGVIGTFNSGCAAIEIPVLNQAPGGGVAMISPANTYVCLTEGGPGCDATEPDKYYPSGSRNYARVVANDAYQGAAVAEFAKAQGVTSVYILNDKEAYGLGVATNFQNAAKNVGIKVAGFEAWDPKAASYEALFREDQRHRCRCSLPRRADRRERRPGDQGQGRGARSERRRGQAVRAGRLHDPADDRRGPRGRSGHVHERRRRADRRSSRVTGAEFARRSSRGSVALPSTRTRSMVRRPPRSCSTRSRASDGTRADVIAKMFEQKINDGYLGTFAINENGDPSRCRRRGRRLHDLQGHGQARDRHDDLSEAGGRRGGARLARRRQDKLGEGLALPQLSFRFFP